jgi:hypothetical protein
MHCPEPEGQNWKFHLRFLSSLWTIYDIVFLCHLVLIYLPGWPFALVTSRFSLYRVPSLIFNVSASNLFLLDRKVPVLLHFGSVTFPFRMRLSSTIQ